MNHVHVSAMHFLITWAYILAGGFLIRSWMLTHPDSALTKALALCAF